MSLAVSRASNTRTTIPAIWNYVITHLFGLLALILCSNCSNTINIVLTTIGGHNVKLLFEPRKFPQACLISSTHGLGISLTALTVHPLFTFFLSHPSLQNPSLFFTVEELGRLIRAQYSTVAFIASSSNKITTYRSGSSLDSRRCLRDLQIYGPSLQWWTILCILCRDKS